MLFNFKVLLSNIHVSKHLDINRLEHEHGLMNIYVVISEHIFKNNYTFF